MMEKKWLDLYLQEMWYVKKRIDAIRYIATHKQTTLFQFTNIEFMTLQIRKIIEHIAMGNLVGGDQIYCIVMNGEKNPQGYQFVRDDEM